jgi:hydrogenase nickel incorporation protein HypA/HybF
MSIVQALIEQVGVEVAESGHDGKVVALGLVIGRLSGVHVDSIRFAFEVLSPGTLVADAQLRIEQPRPVLNCRDCRARHEIDEITVECDCCGSRNVSIEGGTELLLHSIEVEEQDEP